ncbi:hypothetical protein P3L10_002144 [Capsicum annuum]
MVFSRVVGMRKSLSIYYLIYQPLFNCIWLAGKHGEKFIIYCWDFIIPLKMVAEGIEFTTRFGRSSFRSYLAAQAINNRYSGSNSQVPDRT